MSPQQVDDTHTVLPVRPLDLERWTEIYQGHDVYVDDIERAVTGLLRGQESMLTALTVVRAYTRQRRVVALMGAAEELRERGLDDAADILGARISRGDA